MSGGTGKHTPDAAAGRAVAVVGLACRYPGATDARAYWRLLRDGEEGITRYAPEDLIARGADPDEVGRPDFVPAKGEVAGSRDFDWRFFRYSRAEAANIDPQQRVFLECASTALDDAGIDPARFPGRVGVYAGCDRTLSSTEDDLSPLVRVVSREKDFVATRVAYKLGLRGPAVTVQTACSTSLTAIHTASQALLGGECDAALAGGVAVSPPGEWGYRYERGSILSPDGHCRPFDEKAAGTVPSEGVGVVVLKRLDDALRDDDHIMAVIRGSALNNDGGDKLGFTAPSVPGQSEVIRYAHRVAGVSPWDIQYVECHGTATPMGDPVEVAALTDAFGPVPDGGGTVWLGSVKSNIGHTSAAAGVAAFIKTVLMLDHRELVPTLHFTAPNPLLELDSSPFRVAVARQPWPRAGTPTAAVSAFGVGGTNAHVILQAAPVRERRATGAGDRVLMVSAVSPEAADRLRTDLAEHLESDPAPRVPEVARTLAGRRTYASRRAFVVGDGAEAARTLREAPATAEPRPLRQAAFLFPGHGVLTHPAGAPAYRLLPEFRRHFDEINEAVRDAYAIDLRPVVADTGAPRSWFDDWAHQQVGLFALGYALGRQLGEWGVKPAALFGNSVGEYAAAALAGVWSPADAAALVYERAQGLRATEPGRMVAVSASPHEIRERLGEREGISISIIGRGGVVLSGPAAPMTALLEGGDLRGLDVRPLNVDRAAHCEIQAPVAERLTGLISAMPSRLPEVPLVSNVTGDWAVPDEVCGPEYWAAQIRRPVQLDGGLETLLRSECDVFVELGPGSTMLGALRLRAEWQPSRRVLPMLGKPADGERTLLRGLGTLWEYGVDAVHDILAGLGEEDGRPSRCSLPGHPFAAGDPGLDAAAPAAAAAGPDSSRTASGRPGATSAEQLWCRALGVPAATPGDDFFGLGGESLMLLNLLTQVREKLGTQISAAEFMREPTFGALLRLVGERATRTVRDEEAGTLLREGTGRPLFLVADAAESALSYHRLARHLEGERPVHGLEPDPAVPLASVEDVARHHVEAMRRLQPAGPYTLGGWSFGAVVAHEMAAQLADLGETVDLLVCLDAYAPGPPGRRLGRTPDFLLGHLGLMAGAVLGCGAVGRQARLNPALRGVLRDKFRLLARHRPRPLSCPALVLKAGVDRRGAASLRDRIRGLYTGALTVEPVHGNHWSMLAEPHAPHLAATVLTALPRDATAQTGSTL